MFLARVCMPNQWPRFFRMALSEKLLLVLSAWRITWDEGGIRKGSWKRFSHTPVLNRYGPDMQGRSAGTIWICSTALLRSDIVATIFLLLVLCRFYLNVAFISSQTSTQCYQLYGTCSRAATIREQCLFNEIRYLWYIRSGNEARCTWVWEWDQVYLGLGMRPGVPWSGNEARCTWVWEWDQVYLGLGMRPGVPWSGNGARCTWVWEWGQVYLGLGMRPGISMIYCYII